MNKPFSIYLDLVRFSAACLVYLWHSNQRMLVQELLPASKYGHSAVIVFFVLSGFVIAYVTDTKEKHWVDYSASRLSRVYSVVIPTLVLTLALDAIGRSLYPAIYAYPFDQFLVRGGASLLMLNEIWLVSITSFSNVPYWSIAFESWYYVLFGVAMFAPRRWRWPILLACGLLVGPKILLLLPVWCTGVLLYHWRWLGGLSMAFSWCLVLLSTFGIYAYHAWEIDKIPAGWTEAQLGAELFRNLTFARNALGDYGLCGLVFCHFAGMRRVAPSLAPLLRRVERPVRWAASYTFTLYLLHQPLFLFWAAVIRGRPETHLFWALVTLMTALSIIVVGYFTENKRQWLRQAIARALAGLQTWVTARRAGAATAG